MDDTLYYWCNHCGANLGKFVEGGAEPSCVDHPDGSVRIAPIPAPDPVA